MRKAKNLARYLWSQQPPAIRQWLAGNASFVGRFGLFFKPAITIGNIGPIDQSKLIFAARRALAERREQKILDIQGREILIAADHGGVILKLMQAGNVAIQASHSMFSILSPNREERLRALDGQFARFGPAAPDFSEMRRAAEDRELDDRECAMLFAEALGGVVALQVRAENAIRSDDVKLEDVVPESFAYFESLCGPDPGDTEPEEYIGRVLPEYRRDLLRRDFVRGLDICLLGSLRDDLTPAQWTLHVSDDQLWDALTACEPRRDPFSLLGALDIALSRQHDERYRAFADDAVAKLVQDTFQRPDGIDTYELLPLFAQLVLDQLNMRENGTLRVPYWKRMCAWMQAAVLLRLTLSIQLNSEGLRNWVQGLRTPAVVHAALLDLRREPMYRAGELSAGALRCEVVGRLMLLRSRHQAAGRIMPRSEEIDAAVHRLADGGQPLGWLLPGPLEGHRRPAGRQELMFPEAEVKKAVDQLTTDPTGPVWSMLAYFSQCFDLGEELLGHARKISAHMNLGGQGVNREQYLSRLTDGCLVAAAQRDVELSRSIVAAVVANAQEIRSAHEAWQVLQILLVASTAFEAQDIWAAWLEEQLAEVAVRLPIGEALKTFLQYLREVEKVLPVTLGIHSRAESILLAAN